MYFNDMNYVLNVEASLQNDPRNRWTLFVVIARERLETVANFGLRVLGLSSGCVMRLH